jgi:TPR repeat protein
MTKPFVQCSLADLAHQLQLAARDASGSGTLSADVVARITPCLLDYTRTKAVLQRHPHVRGSSGLGLVCSSSADSKQAWCSMLRDLFQSAGVSVSDAAQLRVYLVVKQCAKLGRVLLPQAGSPLGVVQFNMRSGGGFERRFTHAQGQVQVQVQGQVSFQTKRTGGDCCAVNSVCSIMRGCSLESLRLLDYQQNMQWPAAHVIEIVSGRWCLQLLAAAEQLHGARVFTRVCNSQGAALVRLQLAPVAQRLRLRSLVPVYEMAMGHRQRLRWMGCGGRGKLALLMSQGGGGGGPMPRDCSALMDCIVRRVAAAQVAATPEGLHAQAQALCAAGECAAAAALLEQAVGLGHLLSRADLAEIFIDGREGIAQDRKRAFELAEEGTRLGCHHCQGVMACCYFYGLGCSEDATRSLALARASAGEGSKYGQWTLGWLYRVGEGGVGQDYAEAVAQYRLAAAQGYDRAQNELGCMYDAGYGVALDYAEALRWFKLAAAQGFSMALDNVGLYYENGLSVAADEAEAIRWYKRAAAAGDTRAAEVLKRLGA